MDIFTIVVSVIGALSGLYCWAESVGYRAASRVMRLADQELAEADAEIAAWWDAARRFHCARVEAQMMSREMHHRAVATVTHYRTFGDLWLDVAVGDEVMVFKCAGCDRVKWRGEEGYVKVCDGVEFCSTDCHEHPQPIAALPINPERRNELRALN